jgi:hypothetical protein
MPHYGVGPDLSFLDEKFKFGLCTHDYWLSRLDKQTTQTHIPNS